MQIGEVVRFQEGQFFNGAVQLGWVQDHPDLAQKVARSFVFHGPRYHGGAGAEQEGIEGAYRLKDTASFLRDLLGSMQAAECGQEPIPIGWRLRDTGRANRICRSQSRRCWRPRMERRRPRCWSRFATPMPTSALTWGRDSLPSANRS